MKKSIILLISVLVILGGCATRPESIHSSFVSHEKYIDLDCPSLATRMIDTRAELDKFSRMQDTKANVDAATVFFVLIPVSKLAGDHEGDVARLKGEVEAVSTAQIKNKCKSL